ncbi:MAG: hypothetical protein ACRDS1_14010 [Pseudonocardiaceae bacterium]
MSRPRPSRRRVLTAGVTLLVGGPAMLAGCTGSPTVVPEDPDPLESPARRAETDSALALAVAHAAGGQAEAQPETGAQPALAAAASALAQDRMAHAITLHAELRRVRPTPAPSDGGLPAAPPVAAPDLANARAALLQAIHAAQDEASRLVIALPGYRAALLASIAACCASHAALLP